MIMQPFVESFCLLLCDSFRSLALVSRILLSFKSQILMKWTIVPFKYCVLIDSDKSNRKYITAWLIRNCKIQNEMWHSKHVSFHSFKIYKSWYFVEDIYNDTQAQINSNVCKNNFEQLTKNCSKCTSAERWHLIWHSQFTVEIFHF